ncbi:MAG: FkbM family methyltransferase [Pseudomonadota bacterium]
MECGGHIGYISIYFSNLVGNTGKVTIFEPGSNNISYLKDNTEKIHNIKFIEAAVGESNGEVQFYEENLSGQNNSIVKDFDGLKENMNNAFIKVSKETRMVKLISLDSYFCEQKNISFIKIDIEGYEWQAICGAKKLISTQKPILMIEVLSSKQEIFDFFYSMNYVMFSPEMNIITESKELNKNIFFLHRISHTSLLDRLGIG